MWAATDTNHQPAGMDEETLEAADEEYPYEDDLQLAAEIGKSLLERNRDLEAQVVQLQQVSVEQSQEIEHLTKQLDALRQVNDSRMRIYEELDKNVQELEKNNQRLIVDSKADKQRIENLSDTIEVLEEKCEELQSKLEDMVAKERKRQKQECRKTRSVPSLRDELDYGDFYFRPDLAKWTQNQFSKQFPMNSCEFEIKNLQDAVRNLRGQQAVEKRKREEMEIEMAVLIHDNQHMDEKVQDLEQRLLETNDLEKQLKQLQLRSEKLCKRCGNEVQSSLPTGVLNKEVEHDEPQMSSEGKVAKLEDGGSVYGSNESINKVIMETREHITNDGNFQSNISILSELESQYYALCQKYESLLQNKIRRRTDDEAAEESASRSFKVSHKEVQTLLVNLQKCVDVTEKGGKQDNPSESPPPYRLLFKDIFATLRKSRIEESPEKQGSVTTPEDSPLDPND